MAALDPYSPCPCGSGQKFKWCCHKVEALAERAHRLYLGGQTDAAVSALDEGLRKEPNNPWLLTRKALYLIRSGRHEPAKRCLTDVLAKAPRHLGAHSLLTRLVIETEGAAAGVAQLQQALTAVPNPGRKELAGLVKVVATFLADEDDYSAALKHLELALSLLPEGVDRGALVSGQRSVEMNPDVSPWEKNPDTLSPAPEGLAGRPRARFDEALGWAGEGLWSSAAAAFETLADDPVAGPAATRNLGFCRLWLADHAAAASALRRYTARLGPSAEAVDLESLCQVIDEPSPDDLVEHVQLSWPLKDRKGLLDTLTASDIADAEGTTPVDPDDPESPEFEQFALLDRPRVEQAVPNLAVTEIPRILGRVLVGADRAILETYDDGRLDRVSDQFTALARGTISPAHPRTKVLGRLPRIQVALAWEWLLPEGLDAGQRLRLSREQGAHLMAEVWPSTPNPSLRGRTPLQAAAAGDAEVPLRAALLQFRQSRDQWTLGFDFEALRDRLRVPAEPAVEPEGLDPEALHVGRLALVPADRLADETLAAFYRRARRFAVNGAVRSAALALSERAEALGRVGVPSMTVYSDLASLAAERFERDAAVEWVELGRRSDPPADRARNAPYWDMLKVRVLSRTEGPESWVPELVTVLDRYSEIGPASEILMANMVDMGLVVLTPDPDRRGEILADTRPLQAMISRFGPRVTTASGRLGVSATKPEIWTPGASADGGGGLWTPGGGNPEAPPGEKKLIIPGR